MLAANEAVAEQLDRRWTCRSCAASTPTRTRSSWRRSPTSPAASATRWTRTSDRFALQRILEQSAGKPEVYAVHYALLRSLKQAVYSPAEEGHYALASEDYCHFTSPIRRYPDLTVHRQLGQWLRTGKAGGDATELVALGEHCSKMERRAETAERELVKLKMLTYMSERIGTEMEVDHHRRGGLRLLRPGGDAAGRGAGPRQHAGGRLLLLRGGDAQPDRPAHRAALPAGRQGAASRWCASICSGGSSTSASCRARPRPSRARRGGMRRTVRK